jgi:Membrane MotB of proton-channel complex MotA/MotB
MAKKHKHEEHVNHERWVVSFADMMTLLFALFVVLYALGVQDLEKLKKLQKSINFAFHIAGDGKTQDAGLFDQQSGGGDVAVPAPLVTAQDGEMREFLKEVLPDYEEVTGNSLEIRQTDDTIALTAPLSDFFEANKPAPLKREILTWLNKTVDGSLQFTSDVKVIIRAPEVLIGRTSLGAPVTSIKLCFERLNALGNAIAINPQIRDGMVGLEFRRQKQEIGRAVGNWEDEATVTLAFSNARPENR